MYAAPKNCPVTAGPGALTVGVFTLADDPTGREAAVTPKRFMVLVANRDYRNGVETSVGVAGAVEAFDPATATWSPAAADKIALPPAGAVLLRVR